MMSSTSNRLWPASAIDAAARTFEVLTCEPRGLALDTSGIGGLPAGPVPLRRLRRRLLSPVTPVAVRDAVWRRLIAAARQPGSERAGWRVAAVGMAVPGLKRAAARLARFYPGEAADVDAEVVAGFVAALDRVDTDERRLCERLVRAGSAAARRLVRDEVASAAAREAAWRSAPPAAPFDHPDLVLVRAVSAGVLSGDEAEVIARTRLEHVPMAVIAAEHGVCVSTATSRRARSEAKLVAAIRAGDLSIPVRPAPSVATPGGPVRPTATPVRSSTASVGPVLASPVRDLAGPAAGWGVRDNTAVGAVASRRRRGGDRPAGRGHNGHPSPGREQRFPNPVTVTAAHPPTSVTGGEHR